MDVSQILKRAAEKSGFIRARYKENNIPDDMSKITVFFFFGDIRSSFILSTLLLKRYREEMKGSKYFILCSWSGHAGIYPYVDEYWEIRDVPFLKRVYYQSKNFENFSKELIPFKRQLNYFFEDVVDEQVLKPFYDKGIKQEFWDRFKHVKRFLPVIPSSNILGDDFNRKMGREGFKLFLSPTMMCEGWHNGEMKFIHVPHQFWLLLAKYLIEKNITPVILQNHLTYDLSPEIPSEGIFLVERDLSKILAAMRASDCVLDVFNGLSRLSVFARAPFLAYEYRNRYNAMKEWEVDGLCCPKSYPGSYIFSFPTILNTEVDIWETGIYDLLMKRLDAYKNISKNSLESASESVEIVPYKRVREHKVKKFGIRFIKLEKEYDS